MIYQINEWIERYEVNTHGRTLAKDDDKLRVMPLEYVRLRVHGHEQGTGYRRLLITAKTKAMEVFGIFCKLLEIAANQPRDLRNGFIRNEKGNAATLEEIAFILGVTNSQVKKAMEILCKIGWLCVKDSVEVVKNEENCTPADPSGPTCTNERAPYITKRNETNTNTKRIRNETLNPTEDNGTQDFDDSIKNQSSPSTSLRLYEVITQLIKPKSKSDVTAFRNFTQWANEQTITGRFNGDLPNRIFAIAKESVHARCPPAAFMAAVKDELGYRPQKAKR